MNVQNYIMTLTITVLCLAVESFGYCNVRNLLYGLANDNLGVLFINKVIILFVVFTLFILFMLRW